MTTFRQIEANRRNARLSTGPVTEEGKRRSRQNAVRHGLTAETVIDVLEDADDYAAFEMAITAEFEAQSAVERELVLRLGSLLWRLRRATAIESGLFKMQARQILEFRRGRHARDARQRTIEPLHQNGSIPSWASVAEAADNAVEETSCLAASDNDPDGLTQSFGRLADLPSCPLEQLSRYEARLWRQASQILFALQFLDTRSPRRAMRPRL